MANPNPDQSGLRPSKPGEVRNPLGISGYTKRKQFTDALIKLLEDRELADPFIRAGMKQAMSGDFNFWKYIYERIEGKIPEAIEEKATAEAVAEDLKKRANGGSHGDSGSPDPMQE